MSYQISRDGKEIGTFTEEEVLAGVEDGSILPSDHLWTSGMEDWVLVESLIEEDEEAELEEVEDAAKTSPDTPQDAEPEEPAPEPPVKKFTKIVVPVVSAGAAAAAPAPPPRVVVQVAPSSRPAVAAVPPPERVVMVPPSIMPGQYGVAGEATASLVFAILSLLCLCFTAVPAVVYGHLALSRIRRSGRAYGGEGLAIAGLVLGYFFIVISIVLAVVLQCDRQCAAVLG